MENKILNPNSNQFSEDEKHYNWIQFMKDSGMEISRPEADKLMEAGTVSLYVELEEFGGYLEGDDPEDTRVLVITEEGVFLRDKKYLVTSPDGFWHNWIELLDIETLTGDRRMPRIEDIGL